MPTKDAGQRATAHVPIAGDVTVGECVANGYRVTVWCVSRCAGRDLNLAGLTRWASYGLAELAAAGRLKCSVCHGDAGSISVSASMRAGAVMVWQRGRGFTTPDA